MTSGMEYCLVSPGNGNTNVRQPHVLFIFIYHLSKIVILMAPYSATYGYLSIHPLVHFVKLQVI